METAEEIEPIKSYAFYNVLWIEMIEGISYRKAIGRV
jgi:hypothetical protein